MTPCGGPAGVEADKIRTELGINYHMVRKESADPKLTVSCGPHCRNTIMKLTKNAAALLLAASLAVSVCATPVFAENPNMKSNVGSNGVSIPATDVLYKVTSKYTWSVPATIDFGQDAGINKHPVVNANVEQSKDNAKSGTAAGTGNNWRGTAPKVMVTENIIGSGKALKITLKSGDGAASRFEIKNDATTLPYSVTTTKETIDGKDTVNYAGKNVDCTGTEILALKAGSNTGSVELKFTLDTSTTTAEISGEYKGTVVFTADAT